ncbi:hypothetical protein BGX27_005702, partial [Mortierella sp. AM989]
ISTRDGEKLVIGSQSFNALVTSSFRLDSKDKPSLGGSTTSLVLKDSKNSLATKVFLDQESVNGALMIAEDKSAWCISKKNVMEQMRQLR